VACFTFFFGGRIGTRSGRHDGERERGGEGEREREVSFFSCFFPEGEKKRPREKI
jgi:hypothetical protein